MSDLFRSGVAISGPPAPPQGNDWQSIFTPSAPDPSQAEGTYARYLGSQYEDEDRNFWDRLFAPIEASQQTLYALTTGRGLWNSIAHGARYFNPWSDEQRISEDEVRETFFGSEADGWVKGAQNLAIALLFDPLMLAPIAKVARAPAGAVRVIDKATNPLALTFDAAKLAATEVVGPLSRTAYGRVFGEEALQNVDRLSTNFMVGIVNRFHGVDPEVANLVKEAENIKQQFLGEGVRVIKSINSLNPDARQFLTRALEDQDVWLRREGDVVLGAQQIDRLNNFDNGLLATGVNPEAFWQTYDRARKLDSDIGEYLVRTGALSDAKYAEMQGTHLRRYYQAFENPLIHAERLDTIIGTADEIGDVAWASKKTLQTALDNVRTELSTSATWDDFREFARGSRGTSGPNPRYLDNRNQLHIKNFTDDLFQYLDTHSAESVTEVLEHVRDDMFGGIVPSNRIYEVVANHLSGSLHVLPGHASLRNKLTESGMRTMMGSNTPAFVFKPFKEHLELIADRTDIPAWYREVLGEITDAAPRIATQAKEVGGLAAARNLFTQLSGTKRVTANAIERLQEAQRVGLDTDEARNIFQQVAADLNVSADDIATDFKRIMDEGVGTQVGQKGSDWASVARNEEKGHLYQMPVDETYGDMSGMWVDAATKAMLRGEDAKDSIRSREGRAFQRLGDLYRDGVGVFKFMKAVFDPTAQARNFLGAAVLANISGFGFDSVKYLPKMMRETIGYFRRGEMGEYMKIADEAGVNIWKSDMASVELGDMAFRYLDDALLNSAEKGFDWSKPFSEVVRALDELSMRVPGARRITEGVTGTPGETLTGMASTTFQWGDNFWKMGMFMKEYDRLSHAWVKQGKSLTQEVRNGFARQAAGLAQESIFNYADVPWAIDFVRKWGIIPFATFPYKAIPFIAKSLYDSPWRVVRYERLADGLNEMQVGSPLDIADEIERLPEHMRDSMVLRLPFDDGQGRPQYVDMSYFMPYGAIKDIIDSGERDIRGFGSGLFRPPIAALYDGLVNNQDSLGRPIYNPAVHKTETQKWEAVGTYWASFMSPAWAPGGSRAQSWGRAMQAVASHEPQQVNWKDIIGTFMRSPTAPIIEALGGESWTRNNMTNKDGSMPQAHAQTSREGPLGAVGNALASVMGGATAANPRPPRMSASERARKVAAIRSRRDLTIAEKNKQIRELRGQ